MSDFIGVLVFIASTSVHLCYSYYQQSILSRKIGGKCIKSANEINSSTLRFDLDVIIVGAGPSGSTAAYYLSKYSDNKLKIGLFDKKKFPRNKPCGDAWCKPALDLLSDMGILEKMEKDGIVNVVKRGGLISPFGYRCINTDGDSYGSVTGCKTYAIKRKIADEYLVKAAAAFDSCSLFEDTEIIAAEFKSIDNNNRDTIDEAYEGYWCVTTRNINGIERVFTSVMLFICDGSTSYLGQKLGIIPAGSQPEAVCSHTYIKGGSHQWKEADGVMIFNKSVLPGYSALFKHYDGDMYLGTYILPGGKATSRCIAPFERDAMEQHPYIRDALGSSFEWSEKRIVAPIRLGGVPKAYDKQLLILGDAAGYVDPLTGEGIHTAMISGQIAASCVVEMFETSDFSLEACKAYSLRCYDSFGYEFLYSYIAAHVIYYIPISIDAIACIGQRRGQSFLDFFGEVMTGVKPKSEFCKPDLLLELLYEMGRQVVIQYILQYPPLQPTNIGTDIIKSQAISKNNKV